MNNFTNQLLRLEIKEKGYKNLFFSPLSIEMLFGLILPGTQGKSREALLNILEISEEEVNSYLAELQNMCNSLPTHEDEHDYSDHTLVKLANSLWYRPDVEVQPQYQRIISNRFPFELFAFSKNPPDTQSAINQWVNKNTNGLIRELKVNFEPRSIAVLLSALYLKGYWSREFKTCEKRHPFHLLDGPDTKQVTFMEIKQNKKGQGNAYYLKKENFHALRLMLTDQRIGLEVYLPHENTGLTSFIDQLQSPDFDTWKKEFTPAPYFHFLMPKFEAEGDFKLSKIADQLGMNSLFDFSDDLTPMLHCNDKMKINEIGQVAKIKIYEEGLEAAAVSYDETMILGSAVVPQTYPMVIFKADHPFLYRIVDTVTNKTLFQGIFTKPKLIQNEDQATPLTHFQKFIKGIFN